MSIHLVNYMCNLLETMIDPYNVASPLDETDRV